MRERGVIESLFYEDTDNSSPRQGQRNLFMEVMLDIRELLMRESGVAPTAPELDEETP
jgi:hypothetical protein